MNASGLRPVSGGDVGGFQNVRIVVEFGTYPQYVSFLPLRGVRGLCDAGGRPVGEAGAWGYVEADEGGVIGGGVGKHVVGGAASRTECEKEHEACPAQDTGRGL